MKQLILSLAEPLVKASLSPETSKGCKIKEEILPFNLSNTQSGSDQDGSYGKMSQTPYQRTNQMISSLYSQSLFNAGIFLPGEFWTQNISDPHSQESGFLLSDILVNNPENLDQYFLSAIAAKGILRRLENRKKKIDPEIRDILVMTADQT